VRGSWAQREKLAADPRDRTTVVNFSAPVEFPGQILPPGTYVFKLVNLPDTHNVAQIQNEGLRM
jgi:hypothetical protein